MVDGYSVDVMGHWEGSNRLAFLTYGLPQRMGNPTFNCFVGADVHQYPYTLITLTDMNNPYTTLRSYNITTDGGTPINIDVDYLTSQVNLDVYRSGRQYPVQVEPDMDSGNISKKYTIREIFNNVPYAQMEMVFPQDPYTLVSNVYGRLIITSD